MNRALAILGFLVAVAYWPGMIDATLVPRWVVLAIMVPVCLLMTRKTAEVPWVVPACLAAAALTMNWAPSLVDGFDDFMHLLVLLGAVWLGASIQDAKPLWKGVILGVLVSAGIAIAQVLGFEMIPQVASPAGLFGNKNFLAEASLVAGIAAVMLGWWSAAAVLGAVLLLTGSKAAIAGAVVALAAWLMPRYPWKSWAVIAILCAVGAVFFATGHPSAMARVPIWLDSVSEIALVGHGIGSFAATFPQYEFAHSEPLQLVYEYGALAVPFFILFISALRGWSSETEVERIILAVLGAVALFSFPFHLPVTACAAAIAAGRILGHRHRVVERDAECRMALGVGA